MKPEGEETEGESRAQITRLRHGRLWMLAGGVGALFAAALAAVIYSDAPPPDVSDLTFVPIKIGEEENLYRALAKLGAELKSKPVIAENEPDDLGPWIDEMDMSFGFPDSLLLLSPADSLWERLLRGEGWTPARVAKWRSGLDAVVAKTEKLSGLARAQGPILEPGYYSVDGWIAIDVIRHLKLAARALQAEGRLHEAIEVSARGWRFARAIRDSRGPLTDYALGMAAMASFERLFCEFASSPEAGDGALRRILAILREDVSGRDGYVDSLKNEFRLNQKILARHTAADAALPQFNKKNPGFLVRSGVFFPLTYKANYTLAVYADRMRGEIKAAGLAPDKYREVIPESGCAECRTSEVHARFHVWNKEGRSLPSVVAPSLRMRGVSSLEWLHAARALNFSRHSVAETVVALRLYHLEHGELPEGLNKLVPEYLPTVPLDYADRQPLRYSREFRAVWSVGEKNLVISAADQEIDKREMVYWLKFAEPASEEEAVAKRNE